MKEIFVNMSNHPSSRWSEEQRAAAEGFLEDFRGPEAEGMLIHDMAFPQIPTDWTAEEVYEYAIWTADEIRSFGPSAVMLQGETTFSYMLNKELADMGILTVAAVSEPVQTVNADGSITKSFAFRGFREVNSFEPEIIGTGADPGSTLVNAGFPSARWSEAQKEAAAGYGDTVDVGFPRVPVDATEEDIAAMAHEKAAQIMSYDPSAVLCSGEASLTYALTRELEANGVQVICACSDRNTIDMPDGTKKVSFDFKGFREVNAPERALDRGEER